MTAVDLRHLAVIFHEGHKAARSFDSPADAALVTALATMAETCVQLAEHPADNDLFGIDRRYTELRDRIF